MQYKGLFLDVDGTLIPYHYEALPTDAVTDAIHKAQKLATVCLVTGRSFSSVEPVLQKLAISSGYVVVNNGSLIINLADKSIVYEQLIETSTLQETLRILKDENIKTYIKDNPFTPSHTYVFSNQYELPKKTYMLFTDEAHSETTIDRIMYKLSHLTTLNIHKTVHKDPTQFGINIMHLNATKLHGVQFLLENLGLTREQVIGVGDSYNDFPLLMASGLKVAMGNAIAELKAIADYIAPAVTEDGVADVVEKFVLPKKNSNPQM